MNKKIIIIGAGPAGLATGYELTKRGQKVLILEKENIVGGLCQTIDYKGFKFDLGGHRFFTKNQEVQRFWEEIMGVDFLLRPRLSRVYYQKKFFAYPIKLFDALPKLGLWQSFLSGLSLLRVRLERIFRKKEEITFEDWVVNRFGRRLFNHFFKSYTEKMWGVSVKELGSDWAAQRLKDMSLWQMIKSLVFKPEAGKIKSMIEEFHYPRFGPGQLYEKVAQKIEEMGGQVRLGVEMVEIVSEGENVKKIIIKNKNGEREEVFGDEFISSAPLDEMIKMIQPEVPANILALVKKMRFRSFFDVCLVVNKKDVFPDNWIYVHEPEVQLLRVQNFKNWSPAMATGENQTPIGAEYVCWKTDELWKMNEVEQIKLATKELEQIGLLKAVLVEGGVVMKNKTAYPVYHLDYKEDLKEIFDYLAKFKNLQTIGRAGLYRYNNMDHSILTGFYAARNVLGEHLDVLAVNADNEFHELGKA